MLFELAAGRRPFHSDNLMAIFYKITHEEANFDLIPQGADYDALMPILKKALAKNLADRYQTAYDFAVDLREWLKAHATTASSQNVLEALVDLEAPTHAPVPMTEAPGLSSAEGGATVDLGPGRRPTAARRGTIAPTRVGVGGKTVVESGPGATMRPGATRVITPPAQRAPRVQPQAQPKASVLPWVAMLLALVAVSVAGYLAWKSQQAPPVVQVAPTPAPTPVATPVPPPVTVAPAPDLGEAGGKAAASIKQAQAAFERGNYDGAVAAAQAALREDAESDAAKKILAQAMIGQRAADQVRSGDSALARGDMAAAEAAAAEALKIAPWDTRAVSLQRRIAEAKAKAQRDAETSASAARAAQVNAALNDAETAFQAKQFEAAIAAYDRALALDPNNVAARTGKQGAISAKMVADAAASGPRAGAGPVRSFVPGRTEAKAPASAGLVGFEDTAGVTVKSGTQAAALPGAIIFDATPQVPKPGEGFRIAVFLANQGSQPIPLTSMSVATNTDGKLQKGQVPPTTATVAPGQRSVVYQTPQGMVWLESTQSWSMEIVITTQRGETYRNTLTWK
jgi:tetratricopeptide (TPR) repeat protein